MRKVTVALVDRANYGRLKPLMQQIDAHPRLQLSILATGSLVLDRFGSVADLVGRDFPKASMARRWCSLEGSTLATQAASIGLAINATVSALAELRPDLVVVIGDRHETLGVAIAAAQTHRTLLHLQGGEYSGSLDNSARWAITKLAHYHVPATEQAQSELIDSGEHPEHILATGCPSADVLAGVRVRRSDRVLSIFHPDTAQPFSAARHVREMLTALLTLNREVDLLWPNIDAGSGAVHKEIRRFRDAPGRRWLHLHTNFQGEEFYAHLGCCALAVGNSSSFVRDTAALGTPVCLVGRRQQGRERGQNVRFAHPTARSIERICRLQLEHGPYTPSYLYGHPGVSRQVAERIETLKPLSLKTYAPARGELEVAGG